MNVFLKKLRDPDHMQNVIATRAGRKMLKGLLEDSLKKAELLEASLADAREEQRLMRKWLGELEA